jgi:hypothetical protein
MHACILSIQRVPFLVLLCISVEHKLIYAVQETRSINVLLPLESLEIIRLFLLTRGSLLEYPLYQYTVGEGATSDSDQSLVDRREWGLFSRAGLPFQGHMEGPPRPLRLFFQVHSSISPAQRLKSVNSACQSGTSEIHPNFQDYYVA